MRCALALLLACAAPASAQTVVAAHTLRARMVIGPQDVSIIAQSVPGMLADPAKAVGMETRVVLYSGRPIRAGQIGPPAIIDRNQIVPLTFRSGGLTIRSEGRALARAGVGDAIRVMNTTSHATVTGIVSADGSVAVGTRAGPRP